jgi:hypothetical protein
MQKEFQDASGYAGNPVGLSKPAEKVLRLCGPSIGETGTRFLKAFPSVSG